MLDKLVGVYSVFWFKERLVEAWLGEVSSKSERFGGIAIMGGVIWDAGGMGMGRMGRMGRVIVVEEECMVETTIGVRIGGVGGFCEVGLGN
jgi:hypothetical protein